VAGTERIASLLLSERLLRASSALVLPHVPGWVTPNQISVARGLLGVVAATCLSLSRLSRAWFVPAAAIIVAGWLFDGVDGDLARARDLTSPRGYFMDRFMDGLAKIAVYLGIATCSYAHFEIIIFAPLIETLNDVITAQRIYLTGADLGAPLGLAHVFLMLLTPLVLTALWPAAPISVFGLGLWWFDIAFLVGMTVSVTEMTLSAIGLCRALAPPSPHSV
jgi:phosphatidylglycerophosphate synthase